MKEEIKTKWVQALRSGEYKQGRARLHRLPSKAHPEETFCCLGVLCELAVQEGVVATKPHPHRREAIYGEEGVEWAGGVLPLRVAEWAGLLARNPRIDLPERPTTSKGEQDVQLVVKPGTTHEVLYRVRITTLNDDAGYTFDQLADVIERCL